MESVHLAKVEDRNLESLAVEQEIRGACDLGGKLEIVEARLAHPEWGAGGSDREWACKARATKRGFGIQGSYSRLSKPVP